MSFSKAKIQRFNDIKDCTPSPAKYNVLSQEKIKLGLISKPGSYTKKNGSPPNSEASSVHSTPCFQTPTVPLKKKKLLGLSFKSTKNGDLEELRERIVECTNKDLYIRDLTEQIDEISAKVNHLQTQNSHLLELKSESDQRLSTLKQQSQEASQQRLKEYNRISENLKEVSQEMKKLRKEYEELKSQNFVDLSKLLEYIGKFQELYNKTLEESRIELEKRTQELESNARDLCQRHFEEIQALENQNSEDILKREHQFQTKHQQLLDELESLKKQHADEINRLEQDLQTVKFQSELVQEQLRQQHSKEVELLKNQHLEALQTVEAQFQLKEEATNRQHLEERRRLEETLQENDAKIRLLEENFQDVNLLTDLQMKEKIDEIESTWQGKLENKEKEHEAILKECQEISEYNIIQCEIEKNQIKKELEEVLAKNGQLEEEMAELKTEKHAYELSINTFRDTIEVLKKRLISSDRDVEQLKEELERSEEKILNFEKKCSELSTQLAEVQVANEELEMQYESTSQLMQGRVEATEKTLLAKVETLKEEARQLIKDKQLLNDVLEQHHEQQLLIGQAQEAISHANSVIESLENKQIELEAELDLCKLKLDQESEEGAEIRKKYIEKSGKLDELAHQFEQVLQELDQAKGKVEELEKLIGPYQEQLEAYRLELKLLNEEKDTIANEAKELSLKYAEILGHQNHQQKIKHLTDLKMKSSELFQKNMDLEGKNCKLSKLIEKLMKENEDLKKTGKKVKIGTEDKENLASPKCLKGSPCPLKDKN